MSGLWFRENRNCRWWIPCPVTQTSRKSLPAGTDPKRGSRRGTHKQRDDTTFALSDGRDNSYLLPSAAELRFRRTLFTEKNRLSKDALRAFRKALSSIFCDPKPTGGVPHIPYCRRRWTGRFEPVLHRCTE